MITSEIREIIRQVFKEKQATLQLVNNYFGWKLDQAQHLSWTGNFMFLNALSCGLLTA